ncbi:unnamed protein product [Lactuca virosa]|uniref:Uncharacterized protein n=1 Tax=Lactuca virosa TaxID=75947 RepID=A0AAU9PVE0_9ASTR|nr:unnamed protein product [Lactuca virosa]
MLPHVIVHHLCDPSSFSLSLRNFDDPLSLSKPKLTEQGKNAVGQIPLSSFVIDSSLFIKIRFSSSICESKASI